MKGEEKLNKQKRFEELLMNTHREGMTTLLADLHKIGFYASPCSSQYHLAKSGGLLEHSLNVYDVAMKLWDGLDLKDVIPEESIAIAALLHDLGKVGDYGKKNYLFVGNVGKPYKSNSDLAYIPHEVRSIVIANRYIRLTEEEEYAIYYHNGKYTNIGETLKKHNPLEMIIHFADMYSCFEIEK